MSSSCVLRIRWFLYIFMSAYLTSLFAAAAAAAVLLSSFVRSFIVVSDLIHLLSSYRCLNIFVLPSKRRTTRKNIYHKWIAENYDDVDGAYTLSLSLSLVHVRVHRTNSQIRWNTKMKSFFRKRTKVNREWVWTVIILWRKQQNISNSSARIHTHTHKKCKTFFMLVFCRLGNANIFHIHMRQMHFQ